MDQVRQDKSHLFWPHFYRREEEAFVMEIHFRDILVSLRFTDFSFNNPVPLKWGEDGNLVGSAVLRVEKKKLYADLILNERINYTNAWLHVAIDAVSQVIGYVFLSHTRNIDLEIPSLTEQVLQKK